MKIRLKRSLCLIRASIFPQYREIYVAVVGGAVICSVLTLCCVKYVTILTSSIVGTAMVIGAIDFFMHSLETINWILNMKPHPMPPPCYGGLLITAWPVTIVISIMVQCFITAWRVDHRKRIYMRHHQQHPHGAHLPHGQPPAPGNPHVPMRRAQSRTRETREEARQRKFRYLYQVRTARGDIISQVSGRVYHLSSVRLDGTQLIHVQTDGPQWIHVSNDFKARVSNLDGGSTAASIEPTIPISIFQ